MATVQNLTWFDEPERQEREHSVSCWCGRKNIWSLSGLCPTHEKDVDK